MSIRKSTFTLSICLIALTAGYVTHAESETDFSLDRSDLEIPAPYFPSKKELTSPEAFQKILKSEKTLALPDDDVDTAHSNDLGISSFQSDPEHVRSKYGFHYTDRGGLLSPGPACELFLNQDGIYGSYGRIINDYISDDIKKNGDSIFLSDSLLGMADAPNACPNWHHLDDQTKIKFWVWTFASIAFAESSCRWNIQETWGVNDYASGLLQLEKNYSLRSYRGPNCAGVSPDDIRKPYANLRCGMDIMKSQLVSQNDSGELEFTGRLYPGPGMTARSYWLRLRKINGASIGRRIRSFTPCNAVSSFLP